MAGLAGFRAEDYRHFYPGVRAGVAYKLLVMLIVVVDSLILQRQGNEGWSRARLFWNKMQLSGLLFGMLQQY